VRKVWVCQEKPPDKPPIKHPEKPKPKSFLDCFSPLPMPKWIPVKGEVPRESMEDQQRRFARLPIKTQNRLKRWFHNITEQTRWFVQVPKTEPSAQSVEIVQIKKISSSSRKRPHDIRNGSSNRKSRASDKMGSTSARQKITSKKDDSLINPSRPSRGEVERREDWPTDAEGTFDLRQSGRRDRPPDKPPPDRPPDNIVQAGNPLWRADFPCHRRQGSHVSDHVVLSGSSAFVGNNNHVQQPSHDRSSFSGVSSYSESPDCRCYEMRKGRWPRYSSDSSVNDTRVVQSHHSNLAQFDAL
jgi:hypothetical protein